MIVPLFLSALAPPNPPPESSSPRHAAIVSVARFPHPGVCEALTTSLAAACDAAPAPARPALIRLLAATAAPAAYELLKDIVREGGSDAAHHAALRCLIDWPDSRATALLITEARRLNAANPTRALVVRGVLRQIHGATRDRDHGAAPPNRLVEWFVKSEQLIRTPDETRLWLAGLANLRHPEALRLVRLRLDDPAVETEAAETALTIAQNLAHGPARDRALDLLKLLAATAKDDSVRSRAARALERQ